MTKLRLLFISVLLAVPLGVATAAPANACTSNLDPDPCDVINRVCRRVVGASCVG
ncbi:MAG: hypothetical protein M3273_05120 [Actinomycetota bacterium]|nr:hypothetical protein [Actinomycetota bacterium]